MNWEQQNCCVFRIPNPNVGSAMSRVLNWETITVALSQWAVKINPLPISCILHLLNFGVSPIFSQTQPSYPWLLTMALNLAHPLNLISTRDSWRVACDWLQLAAFVPCTAIPFQPVCFVYIFLSGASRLRTHDGSIVAQLRSSKDIS
jgi:hypothetical protein